MIMTFLKLLISFFANIVSNLKIIPSEIFTTIIQYEREHLVQNAINKFKNRPIIKIRTSKINPNKIIS